MNKYLKCKNYIFTKMAMYKMAKKIGKERRELERILEQLKKSRKIAAYPF